MQIFIMNVKLFLDVIFSRILIIFLRNSSELWNLFDSMCRAYLSPNNPKKKDLEEGRTLIPRLID